MNQDESMRDKAEAKDTPSCTIEDWRWSYEPNDLVERGGWIKIDGVLTGYAGFDFIYIRAYEVGADGERDQYLGNQSGEIEPGGSFQVSIESSRPSSQVIIIDYTCD